MRKVWLLRMTGRKLLKKDILLGTLRKWYQYIIVVAAAYFASREMFHAIQVGLDGGYLFDNGTFLDALLCCADWNRSRSGRTESWNHVFSLFRGIDELLFWKQYAVCFCK